MSGSESADTARDLYGRLLAAWNDRDARGFAALFAPDGVLIGFDGSTATGVEIAEHLTSVFADHVTAPYVAKVREARMLTADVALVRAIVGMVPPGRDEVNPAVNAVQSLVVQRDRAGWRIVLMQTTPAQHHGRPDLVERHTAQIEAVRAAGTVVG